MCDSVTLLCADSGHDLFAGATEKIWSQAGITIQFLGWSTISAPSSDYLNLTSISSFDALDALSRFQSDSSQIVWMFFVPGIMDCGGAAGTVYGCGPVAGNSLAISNATFSYSKVGRMDTISHELAHTLGLADCSTCSANNLLADGSFRDVPQTLNDIYPSGARYDQLIKAQITTALASPYLTHAPPSVGTPEPVQWAVTALAIVPILLRARRYGRPT